MTQPVFRFAPSPNGRLHLGHAYSAILNHDMARSAGGRFLLRIEDIDTGRCKPEYIDAALEDLRWLGLKWEEPVRQQSRHFADYAAALDKLKWMGLVYPAFLSRSEIARRVNEIEADGTIWPRDPEGAPLYPGEERDWSAGESERSITTVQPFAWRLDMAKALHAIDLPLAWTETNSGNARQVAADPSIWGDVMLARKDVPTSYHLSVVIDDALQGVTDVVRGMDLFNATSIHRLLQALLGLPAPRYCHHRLIVDSTGEKLAKSARSPSLASMRQGGASPADVRRLAGLET